jgi:cation/acetate symporter
VAASANLPTILYSLFWKRFNTTGALWSIYGGLASCVLLIIFSPAVSGGASSMIKGVDFHLFPLANPGLVSIPLSFVLGIVGTYVGGKQPVEEGKFAEMEVRSLTGAGSEKAVVH